MEISAAAAAIIQGLQHLSLGNKFKLTNIKEKVIIIINNKTRMGFFIVHRMCWNINIKVAAKNK